MRKKRGGGGGGGEVGYDHMHNKELTKMINFFHQTQFLYQLCRVHS